MTFCIGEIYFDRGRWAFCVKGCKQDSGYCWLETDLSGKGLVALSAAHIFGGIGEEQILSKAEFEVPRNTTPVRARNLLAAALRRLGWGPEVDCKGRVRRRRIVLRH